LTGRGKDALHDLQEGIQSQRWLQAVPVDSRRVPMKQSVVEGPGS